MDITRQDYRPGKRPRLEEDHLRPLNHTEQLQPYEAKVVADHLGQFQSGLAPVTRLSHRLPAIQFNRGSYGDVYDTTVGFPRRFESGANRSAGHQSQDVSFPCPPCDYNRSDHSEYLDDSSTARIHRASTSISHTLPHASQVGPPFNAFAGDNHFHNPFQKQSNRMDSLGVLPISSLLSPQVNGDLGYSILSNAYTGSTETREQATTIGSETTCFGMVRLCLSYYK